MQYALSFYNASTQQVNFFLEDPVLLQIGVFRKS